MDNEKKQSSEKKPAGGWWDTGYCGPQGRFGAFQGCCEGASEAPDCRSMMAMCMKACRWLPLIPVTIGVLFLLLGFYFDAEVTRGLWMIFGASLTSMGILGLIMAGMMRNMCRGTRPENQMP
jgi:hypothetical protein